jgi:hypothetical protein
MLKASRRIVFVAVFCLLFTTWGSVQAQTSDVEYFQQTGHSIQGEFLRYYQSFPNPTYNFGYPLTEQFTSKDGKTVQYFQRARFELATDSTSPVKLTPLGSLMYSPGDRQVPVNNPLACRTFPETGYSVCFAFLEFFEQNGGVERFGPPITPFEFHNNQIVQYFENARLEWQPGLGEGQRIGLTDLGKLYFDQTGEERAFLRPIQQGITGPNPIPIPEREVLNLQVRAFPAKAVTTPTNQQTIYVLVQDQNLQAVGNASGFATIQLPDGQLLSRTFSVNEKGVGTFDFEFQNQPNGKLVYINISVTYNNDLQETTATSFRIWY